MVANIYKPEPMSATQILQRQAKACNIDDEIKALDISNQGIWDQLQKYIKGEIGTLKMYVTDIQKLNRKATLITLATCANVILVIAQISFCILAITYNTPLGISLAIFSNFLAHHAKKQVLFEEKRINQHPKKKKKEEIEEKKEIPKQKSKNRSSLFLECFFTGSYSYSQKVYSMLKRRNDYKQYKNTSKIGLASSLKKLKAANLKGEDLLSTNPIHKQLMEIYEKIISIKLPTTMYSKNLEAEKEFKKMGL